MIIRHCMNSCDGTSKGPSNSRKTVRGAVRGVIFAPAALVLFWAQASNGQAAAAARDWTWGVAIGSPQLLAATLETRANATLRVQCHAGTLIVLSSVGIRAVMLSRREGIAPYVYLGAGIVHTAEGEGGGS
jgi:hypothetical protein